LVSWTWQTRLFQDPKDAKKEPDGQRTKQPQGLSPIPFSSNRQLTSMLPARHRLIYRVSLPTADDFRVKHTRSGERRESFPSGYQGIRKVSISRAVEKCSGSSRAYTSADAIGAYHIWLNIPHGRRDAALNTPLVVLEDNGRF
jgi:hypothetical protein